ncbi:putative Membrane dipeptidase [Candidatus Hydrogenisulfobacillus filiaventi]|uniref:Putative Membrane dipeptidase n=1 Tax=Candidatus Hydrogenisulfobacillus filiaventi TaxID=2707344 RepID=A0A6F8ZFV5_9FIRM|nr:putative Membrane dipeptidase [Candidatus Hydrogenisulfobacillus filiaventi]
MGARMTIVDTHADSLGAVLAGRRRLFDPAAEGQWDFVRATQSGQRLQFLSCWVEPEYVPDRALARLLAYIEAFWREVEAAPGLVRPVRAAEDLAGVVAGAPLGVALAVEGGDALGTDPGRVSLLYRLGVRMLSLTWNGRNQLADGAEEPGAGGLSRAGRRMVEAMNRVGMIPDVSHLAERGFWELLEIAALPPVASHSNCRALADHPRNLSDVQIRALAERGGVQGITYVRAFLGGTADLERVVDHVLHVLDVTGTDSSVGLGSDFDGVEEAVPGLEDVSRVGALAERLSGRGLSEATVARVMGGNWLRYLEQVWGGTPALHYRL